MANSAAASETKIFLEAESLEAFKTKASKERIEALKATFFPPLNILVEHCLSLIREIYQVEPTETMTKVYRPSNRKEAEVNTVSNVAYVGMSGQRRNSQKDSPLSYPNRDGKPIYIHPAYLTIDIYANGVAAVDFLPFRNSVDPHFALKVCRLMREHLEVLSDIFEKVGILHSSRSTHFSTDFAALLQDSNFKPRDKREIHEIELHSYAYELPLSHEDCWDLALIFAALYPLLEAFIQIGNGEEPDLGQRLEKFNDYYERQFQSPPDSIVEATEASAAAEKGTVQSKGEIDKPELESENDSGLEATSFEGFEDARQRRDASIVARLGQSAFRQALLRAYDQHCVITDCDAEAALEAANIVPYRGKAANHPSNGLLLRGDVHSLFDRYLLSINPDTYAIEIAPELSNTCYQELQGRLIRLPQEKSHKPAQNALRHHHKRFLNPHRRQPSSSFASIDSKPE